MAKDITLKDKNGGIKYPKTVTAIVYENGTGKTLQTIIEEMRQMDAATNTRTQHFKADVNNLDTLKNKTDIGLYNYVGTGWRGSVSVCYDSADNVSQVALSSSTPSYNGNTLTWLSAQPCAMARTYTNGAWSHWEKVGAPVVNDLTTGGTDKALSAEMGKTLKEGLDALGPKIGEVADNVAVPASTSTGIDVISSHNLVNLASGREYVVRIDDADGIITSENCTFILYSSTDRTSKVSETSIATNTNVTFTPAANIASFSLYKGNALIGSNGNVYVTIAEGIHKELMKQDARIDDVENSIEDIETDVTTLNEKIGYMMQDNDIVVSASNGVDIISSSRAIELNKGEEYAIRIDDPNGCIVTGGTLTVQTYRTNQYTSGQKIAEYSGNNVGDYLFITPAENAKSVSVYLSPTNTKAAGNIKLSIYSGLKKDLIKATIEDVTNGLVAVVVGKELVISNAKYSYYMTLDANDGFYDGNHCINFRRFYHKSSGNASYISDDIAPVHVLNTTIGANHGQPCKKATIAGHGLTDASIGSEWMLGNKRIYLLRIVDENNLLFIGENTGTASSPSFASVTTGTITNSGTSLTISSVADAQMRPSLKNISQQIVVDGKVVEGDGVYKGEVIDLVESYNIIDPTSALDNLIGLGEESTFDGDLLMLVENVYRFCGNLNVVNYQTITALKSMAFENLMFAQSSAAATLLSYYMPNSAAFASYDLRQPVTVTLPLLQRIEATITDMPDQDHPANRVLSYGSQYGYAFGYAPFGIANDLKDYTTMTFTIRQDSGKVYLRPVEGSKVGSTLNPNQAFSLITYKCPIDKSTATGNRLSFYNVTINNAEFIFADYKGAMLDNVDIGDKFNGKGVEVVESKNCELVSPYYYNGVKVKANFVSGESCFIVLKVS